MGNTAMVAPGQPWEEFRGHQYLIPDFGLELKVPDTFGEVTD
jgi:hypothetical protein